MRKFSASPASLPRSCGEDRHWRASGEAHAVIVSIMQPYFFPYIGFFQLMSACDVFVMRDDAQYIKDGWVNRNRILVHSRPAWLTFPVASADHRRSINQREYLMEGRKRPLSLLRKIEGAYRTAPHFSSAIPLVEEIMSHPGANVASFNINLLRTLARAFGITARIAVSSEVDKQTGLVGPAMVVELCRQFNADRYVNPIGGIHLYDSAYFSANGLELSFLQSSVPSYPQFGMPHVASLSIIDVMMFNGLDAIKQMLGQYRLVDGFTARATATPNP
jgi:hypothetical protein